ncbi:hypothetical protein DFQ27_002253, partial [Actinomortierella ambigua]
MCPKADPSFQLAVALARLAINGTGASVAQLQATFGIGKGTVTLYTHRVLEVLDEVKHNWVTWPDARRRNEQSQVMRQEGFQAAWASLTALRYHSAKSP